uniref:Arginine/serine-rich coiled-coil protein 2 n=1 Tax=Ciona intestinalis TaxID=7719 RepID=F6QTB8_CIOIN
MKDGASNGNQIAEESSTSEDGKKETAEAAAVKKIKRENLRKRSTSVDRSSSSSSSSSSESEEERKKKKKKYRKRKSRSPKRKHTKSKKSRKSRERSVSSDRSASRRTKERRSRSRDRRSRSRDRRSRSRDKKKRSRSRDRTHKSRDRRNVSRERRSRSRDRRRSRDGKRRSRSRDRRNSRSRDRRRSRSRERRRSRSRDRSRRRRSQSRDRRPRSSSSSPYRFGFDKAMDSQERLARRLERAKELTRIKQEEEAKKSEKAAQAIMTTSPKDPGSVAVQPIISFYAFFAYSYRFLPFFSTKPSPQMLALKAQAEKATGITIPSYYNPNVINPLSYATQEAKRKKLWSKAEVISLSISGSVWSKMTLGDNKTDEKFAKLMGIKSNAKQGVGTEVDADGVMKKQQELMSNLDMQYQQARITTHTQRGVGLGFSSAYVNPNAVATQQAADNTAQPPPAT